MKTPKGLLLAAALLALTGCSAAAPAATPEAAYSAEAALPDKCVTVTAGAVRALQEDIAVTVPGVEFTGAGAMKSESGDEFWYIALTWDDDGTRYTGTWGTLQDPTQNEEIAYVAADTMAALTSTYKQPVAFEGLTSSMIGADDCVR